MLKHKSLFDVDGEEINPKALQALGTEKMKVNSLTFTNSSTTCFLYIGSITSAHIVTYMEITKPARMTTY